MTRIKFNKSQSALEFLTTYGWAFLVILLMIAALGYFGVMNPTKFLPERCMVDSEFSCEEYSLEYVKETDTLVGVVFVRNVMGTNVKVTDFKLSGDIIKKFDKTNANFLTEDYEFLSYEDFYTNVFLYDIKSYETNNIFSINVDDIVQADKEPIAIGFIVSKDSLTVPPSSLKGTKQKVEFTITYVPEGKSIPKQIVGEMFTTVQ